MEQNWRELAIDAALTAESENEECISILLREIRHSCPSHATLMLWPDRLQLLRFLERETSGVRSLLNGQQLHLERDQLCPYVGWYACFWQGTPLEIALAPSLGAGGCAVIIAADTAVLLPFANALEAYTVRPAGRCLRYARGWTSAPELDAEIGRVTWEDLVLPPEQLGALRETIEGFYHHREAFTAFGFPWRRGVLLIGPPGTGKTMVCKAAAAALPELPFLYVRDFEGYGREDAVHTIFRRARDLAPCILAFEDIDGLATPDYRTVFLNELDGFQNNNGLLIIASSNHPEKIDEALLKRPSRFDRVFHLGLPGHAERHEYCRRMLQSAQLARHMLPALDAEALALQVAARTDGFTPAYLKEVFISAALRQVQSGISVLDEQFFAAVLQQVEALRDYLRQVQDPEALAELGTAMGQGLGFMLPRRSVG